VAREEINPAPTTQIKVLPETDPQFRAEDGTVDQAKYLAYWRSTQPPDSADSLHPGASYVDEAVATFLVARQEEAIVADGLHAWPDGLPWNRQPWWKWQLWRQYWAGKDDRPDD
jgi:hypothetical protein